MLTKGWRSDSEIKTGIIMTKEVFNKSIYFALGFEEKTGYVLS